MELRAALEGLAAVPGRRRVEVHTDSAYVMNCFRDRWYEKWEANGWVGAGKKPVTNRDLWERADRPDPPPRRALGEGARGTAAT